MVKAIGCLKVNSKAVGSEQKEKSFHSKFRVRRQYNPDDINIAKLFLAIREHRTDNPQLNKISEIERLLTQVQNINNIDLNDGGNTLLHVAVSKDHQDIIELLLNVSGIDQNIKNKDGKTPLDIAKQSNKEKIIQILEEHLKKSSGQVKRLSAQEKEVHEKLRKFVKDFVFIYERSLSEYYERLENERGKPGKWADFVNTLIYTGQGGTEGTEETEVKAFSLIGINVLRLAISGIGSHHNRAELKKLMDQLYIFKTNPIKVREELVKSGIEIFQSFESQFVQVTANGRWERAMTKLAEDAVSRVVDYYRKNTEEEFCANSITKGIVFGKSKKYKQISTGIPHAEAGHTLESKSSNSWNTEKLFNKAGLVTTKSDGNADRYYKRRDGKSNTGKYGYRLLLNWEKVNEDYDLESSNGEEYRYVLKSNEKIKEKWQGELLNEINKQDSKLVEEGLLSNFKEEMNPEVEKNFNELEGYIGENFRELSSYIESNRKEIEGVFSELIKQHQEAIQQRYKIADSIKEGRKESEESFEKVDKKLDKIYDAVVAKPQVREPVWFGVKKPVSLFTGREEELIDLHNKMQRSREKMTVISQITSISGLGGIGKTELAREYIQEYSKDYYNDVIWINAESEVSIIESFTRLAKDKLKIDTKDANGKEKDIKSIIEEVYKFFSNSKSLFIFDDAERSYYLNKFLPLHDLLPDDNVPYVLITSRNREWERGIEVINLNELKLEEAIEFVKKGLDIKDESQDKEIKALVEKLQYFPLAIQQAIAYIADQRITGEFDIDDYLEEYEKKTKDLLDSEVFRGINNDYAKTTFTTWKITTDKIASNKEYGELALRILNVISYLAPDRISREVFLDFAGSSENELRSAVRLLIKYSMVSGEQKQSIFSVHKLVQDVTRIVLEEQGKSEEVMDETFKLLETSFPYGSNKLEDYLKKRELLPHLEAFLSHIDNWLKKNSEDKEKIEEDYLEGLLIWMSDGYFNKNNPERQKELLERALPLLEKHYGAENFKVAIVLVSLSNACVALGDYQRAKELLEKTLKIEREHYGEGYFEVAKILVNLSVTYRVLGDYEGARELLERALPILENHYGREHYEVAKILVDLSITCGISGDYERARELLERALSIFGDNYGTDQLEAAKLSVNLSINYVTLGDYGRAKELLERALPILENHYGRDHFQVAQTLVILSICYGALDAHERAKELLEKALPVLEKHYGEKHLEVAKTLVNLSITYSALDDHEGAKELLERALPILENHYGEDNFEVATAQISLGMTYIALSNYGRAKELLEKALPILEKHYGEEHFEIGIILENLSMVCLVLRDYERAKESLERALPILEKHYREDHFEVAIALENLAVADSALGDHERAKELLERALLILEKHYGEDHYEVAKTLVNLSTIYGFLEDYRIQKELIERALPTLEKHYGAEHFEVAKALISLSITCSVFGDEQRAQKLLERAFAIYQRDQVLVGKCLSKREIGSKCLFQWKNFDEFNVGVGKKRDFSKIKIGSKKFVNYINDLPEGERSQLIELVDRVQFIDRFHGLINSLNSNQKVMHHLNRVKKISSITMHGMMAKNILTDFLNGDYQGVAINVGFIAGGQGFAQVAEAAFLQGLNLLSEGKVLLGRSLRVASPFLARGTSAFIVYDLVNQVKAFRNGTEGALVGVVGDSIYHCH